MSPVNARAVSAISVKIRAAEDPAQAEAQVRALLRQSHGLIVDQPDDFWMTSVVDVLSAQEEASKIKQRLLAAIATVSLLVGDVGVTNVMLVSVTERTREIRVRMAVGARGRDIRLPFPAEAATLGLAGGVLGIELGVLGAHALARFVGWPILVAPEAALLATALTAAVAILFGFYPASHAASVSPIEALSHEVPPEPAPAHADTGSGLAPPPACGYQDWARSRCRIARPDPVASALRVSGEQQRKKLRGREKSDAGAREVPVVGPERGVQVQGERERRHIAGIAMCDQARCFRDRAAVRRFRVGGKRQ